MDSLTWRKSSRSNNNGGACVEAAALSDAAVALRDSKVPSAGALRLPASQWTALLRQLH